MQLTTLPITCYLVKKLNLEELHGQVAEQYAVKVSNKFDALQAAKNANKSPDEWQDTKEVLLETARENVGHTKHTNRRHT